MGSKTVRIDGDRARPPRRAVSTISSETGRDVVSTGLPLDGVEIEIVDAEGRGLPEGDIGTVALSGKFIFASYFRLEEETLRKLRGGKFYTTDLGFLRDGELYITGRSADLIIIHGRNYYAHELESIVNEVDGVHAGRCVALGYFRTETGSQEAIVLAEASLEQAQEGEPELARRIRRAVLDQVGLPPWDVRIVPPGWLRKTTSGKISRSENLSNYIVQYINGCAESINP